MVAKLKDSVEIASKCYLCEALHHGMHAKLRCKVSEREAIRNSKKKSCRWVMIESKKSPNKE